MSPHKALFLIGPGFIGGGLLVRLKETRPDLKLSALTRREDQAKELRDLGIEPILGSLDDVDLIRQHAAQADIVIHAATADHEASSLAAVEGIKSRSDKSKKVIFIQTSGNDELVNSAKGLSTASWQERVLSDTRGDGYLEERIQPDAYHRQVDGPLRRALVNEEQEKEHNVSATIMMPPCIYGIGSEPWKRISIQIPMLCKAMMDKGVATLPEGATGRWNAVWVHDLIEAYLCLLQELEAHTPGSPQPSHYLFPAEPTPFVWKELLDTIILALKRAGHPSAKADPTILDEQTFFDFIGGKENAYASVFVQLIFGKENSYTTPDRLSSAGFAHKGKGAVDSIINGGELDKFIAEQSGK